MSFRPSNKWFAISFGSLSFLGFLDATYLAVQHYRGIPVTCSIIKGCDIVTSSSFSVIFGVSVALLGAIYYLSIFILSASYLDSKKIKSLYWISRLTWVGFIASLWFLYLQLFVIKAICIFCLGSALTSTLLFILGILFIVKLRHYE